MEFEKFKSREIKTLLSKLECDNILDVKKCYHKLVLKLHPDKNPGKDTTVEFQEIQNIWEIMKDNKKLEEYIKKNGKTFRS